MAILKYDPTNMTELRALINAESKDQQLEEITLDKVLIGKNVIEQIPATLEAISEAELKAVLIVADETPIRCGNALLRELLLDILSKKGFKAELVILKADEVGLLHADVETVEKVKKRVGEREGIIAVGGGTIADICKYAAFLATNERSESKRVPLIVCQTATSGSAFGSNQSVIFDKGVKRTFHSIYPSAIIADIDVISGAPREMNIAGFGDMAGILISSVDWYASHLVGMADRYNEVLVRIMEDSGGALLNIGREVGALSVGGMESLAKILVMMGIVSSLGYGTTPISGFDHMISHTLDFEGLASGRRLALHGAQVGLGAIYASVAYSFFIKEFSPRSVDLETCYPSDNQAYEEIKNRFGHLDSDGRSLEEIWSHYKDKLRLWRKNRPNFEGLLADWEKAGGFRDQISAKMKAPEQIIKALYASGNPTVSEELIPPVSDDEMKFAFLNSRFIRNRFILSDIMGFIGMLDENFWHRTDEEVRRIAASNRS